MRDALVISWLFAKLSFLLATLAIGSLFAPAQCMAIWERLVYAYSLGDPPQPPDEG